MDFSLSEEQKQVQDLINQFIAKDYPFDVREKLVKSEDGFSKEYWKTFGEFGLLAMPFLKTMEALTVDRSILW